MAVGVSGCIVTSERGTESRLTIKCENCGYIFPGGMSIPTPGHMSTYTSIKPCPKCKKNFKIIVKG